MLATMATPRINTKSPTIRRIMREAQELSSAPSPDYTATPLETDLFEWHFTLRGPPNSSFAGGIYHGRIVLPPTYPLRPPSFRFSTPSGRFEVNREICLSISGHHEETWQPAWGVRTALVALRSFMETDAGGQLGGLETSDAVRRRLAAESPSWRCAACGGKPNAEIMTECERAAREAEEAAAKEQGGVSKRVETEVPKELKMGWRDEMEKKEGNTPAGGAAPGEDDDTERAELAEGFVQTVPVAPGERVAAAAGAQQPPSALPPSAQSQRQPERPGQSVPQPTRTSPLQNPLPAARPPQVAQRHPTSSNGVPLWVDRAIVVLSVLLVALLFKFMAGE